MKGLNSNPVPSILHIEIFISSIYLDLISCSWKFNKERAIDIRFFESLLNHPKLYHKNLPNILLKKDLPDLSNCLIPT